MNLEEHNYWNDSRVRAGMIDRGRMDGDHLVIEVDEKEVRLLTKLEICPTCRGKGTHVNPSIDANGLTAEDFDRDPDFREDYMSGIYDQICNECHGLRVVPVIDRVGNSKEDIKRYDEYIESEQQYAAEVAAERRMGA
ncbi:hypothetical protein LCGC14_0781470 [marine sediment metagenome]|uniref:Uncharacterized protein n=1 Tax=marine sediment metagenome TaxID=412755 RepID=A0A0F9PVJ0_9ZZZZ